MLTFNAALMAASETITVDEKKKDGRVKDILRKRLSSQESGSPVVIYPEGRVTTVVLHHAYYSIVAFP